MRRRFMGNGLAQFDVNNYLTIEALEDGLTIIFPQNLEYGIDGLGWQRLPAGKSSTPIKKGQVISFKAELVPTGIDEVGVFLIDGKCNLLGNAMSLLASNELTERCFFRLFRNCVAICSVSEGFLPATTLAEDCYAEMFYGCTSLVNAPALPATSLRRNCYSYMFRGCTKLNYIKALFTTPPSSSYTSNWVNGVASSGTFVKNKNATWNLRGVNGVPNGWTIQNV